MNRTALTAYLRAIQRADQAVRQLSPSSLMASKPKKDKKLAVTIYRTVDTRNGPKGKLEVEAACPDPPVGIPVTATANVSTASTRTAGLSSGSARSADALDAFFRAQRHRIDTARSWKVFGGRHISSACVDESDED